MSEDLKTTDSPTGADSLDRIVGHFNEVFQCDYTADDLRWDIHNGDKTAAVGGSKRWMPCGNACLRKNTSTTQSRQK